MITLDVIGLNRVKKDEPKEEEVEEKDLLGRTFPKKKKQQRDPNQPWSALDRFRKAE